jgi:hypothetical protein
LFAALGFLPGPDGFWARLWAWLNSRQPEAIPQGLVINFLAYSFLAWLLGSAVETALAAIGLRIEKANDQAADYDDKPPDV